MDSFSSDIYKITFHALPETIPMAGFLAFTIQKLYVLAIISIYSCVSGMPKTV